MSKGIFKTVLSIASIAVAFIPGIGWAARAALTIGLALTSSVLLGPRKPKQITSPTERLSVSIDPSAPRKITFGNTAMATDLRYQVFAGTNQEYYHQIICLASHEVESIDEIWLDNEKAWNGSVLGRFAGYLTVATRTVGTAANGIAIDSVWTANARLTGCAYVHLRFKLTGNSKKAESPFAGGVTTRITIRGKGAKVYDPRLDSTVSGGSGAHRANDQATWQYATAATSGRNPALQLLFYLLGWKINSKLAVGMGIQPARIDLPSFITAANICDENIALAGGGTEKRYRSDGIISEADDRQAVIEQLCATMNAVLRDAGGKIALVVMKNDLAVPAASFSEADVLGDEEWKQTPPLNETFNIVRGRYIDDSDKALYQPKDFPEVKLTSIDGIDRIETVDYPLVQSSGQAQRLAKQHLQRNQYQGRYTATLGPRAWQVSLGDVVEFSHAGLGWTDKLFRIAAQTITRTGETRCVMVEENAAIYAWDAEEAAAVTPGDATVYDPLNNPFIQGIAEAAYTTVGPAQADMLYDSTGTTLQSAEPLQYAVQSGDATLTGTSMTYTVISGSFNGFTSASGAQTITVTNGIGEITPTALATDSATLSIVASVGGTALPAFQTVVTKVRAAATGGGSPGDNPNQTSGFTAINTSTFTTITGVLTFTLPTGKTTLRCVVDLTNRYPKTANQTGPWNVEFKVQRDISGTYTDQGSVQNSNPDNEIVEIEEFGTFSSPGTMQATIDMTGLTAGTKYSVRVQARVSSGTLPSNGVNMSFTGQVTLSAP